MILGFIFSLQYKIEIHLQDYYAKKFWLTEHNQYFEIQTFLFSAFGGERHVWAPGVLVLYIGNSDRQATPGEEGLHSEGVGPRVCRNQKPQQSTHQLNISLVDTGNLTRVIVNFLIY